MSYPRSIFIFSIIESGSINSRKFFFTNSMQKYIPIHKYVDTYLIVIIIQRKIMKLLINSTKSYFALMQFNLLLTFVNLNILYLYIFPYIVHASKTFVIHKFFPYFRCYFRICLSKESHIAGLQNLKCKYFQLFIKFKQLNY